MRSYLTSPLKTDLRQSPYSCFSSVKDFFFFFFKHTFLWVLDNSRLQLESCKNSHRQSSRGDPSPLPQNLEVCKDPPTPTIWKCVKIPPSPSPKSGTVSRPPSPKSGTVSRPPSPKSGTVSRPPSPKSGTVSRPPSPKSGMVSRPPSPKSGTVSRPFSPKSGTVSRPPSPKSGTVSRPPPPPLPQNLEVCQDRLTPFPKIWKCKAARKVPWDFASNDPFKSPQETHKPGTHNTV